MLKGSLSNVHKLLLSKSVFSCLHCEEHIEINILLLEKMKKCVVEEVYNFRRSYRFYPTTEVHAVLESDEKNYR